MSRQLRLSGHALLAASALLLLGIGVACEEDGKTAPAKCGDGLPIYDIQGGQADEVAAAEQNPCVTKLGHATNDNGPGSSGGTSNGGTSAGGSSTGGGGTSGSPTGGNAGAAGDASTAAGAGGA